jgi:ATP-dependent DNA helicase RecQ
MLSLLKKHFGYEQFRPMQLDIINCVLNNEDSLVLMPTGGGKSLCFQIPALQMSGITLVISPLISLMKDQVDSLKANGVNAEFINSTLSTIEIESIKQRCRNKEIKLLYIAPERLALQRFKVFLSSLQISLIAIDEAHCISEWGHDFRKDYNNLRILKRLYPNVPIMALTATATVKVREDILRQLSLNQPKIFISSFDRSNLNLIVRPKKNSINKIVSTIKEHDNESIIIYCFSRKDTESISQKLNQAGYSALPYHAGLSNLIRKKNQELFIKDDVNIMVATIAFGMGIDKPDIRLVIHHTFSKSLEGYYQEIGRAGRDGLQSDCVLLYSRRDMRKHEYFLNKMYDSSLKTKSLDKLNQMINFCENKSCRRKTILRYFGEQFPETKCDGCDICLNITELPEIELPKTVIKKTFNNNLFERLRVLRKEIAKERNLPPFIIFGNVSLREMASHLPTNKNTFLEINGVGQHKLNDFGDRFLEVINDYINENNIVSNESHKRLNAIKEVYPNAYASWSLAEDNKLRNLYEVNLSIKDMAQVLKRNPGAIRSRLKKQGLF